MPSSGSFALICFVISSVGWASDQSLPVPPNPPTNLTLGNYSTNLTTPPIGGGYGISIGGNVFQPPDALSIQQQLNTIHLRYTVFDSTGTSSGNCFDTMQQATDKLKGMGLSVNRWNTGFDSFGVFSITHPALIATDPKTHQVYAITTFLNLKTGYNQIEVTSLGVSPDEKTEASFLMWADNSPMAQSQNTIYGKAYTLRAWAEGANPSPGIDVCQDAMLLRTGGNIPELVLGSDGSASAVFRSSGHNNLPLGMTAGYKSMAILPVADAAGVEALHVASKQIFGASSVSVNNTLDLLAALGLGNGVTRLYIDKKLNDRLSVGVADFARYDPELAAQGFTKITPYAQYHLGDFSASLDASGTGGVQYDFKNGWVATVGKDAGDHAIQYNLNYTHPLNSTSSITASLGVGSSIGNFANPYAASLTNATGNYLGGTHGYATIGYHLSFANGSSSRSPASDSDAKVVRTRQSGSIDLPNGKNQTIRYQQITIQNKDGKVSETYFTDGVKDPVTHQPRKFNSAQALLDKRTEEALVKQLVRDAHDDEP